MVHPSLQPHSCASPSPCLNETLPSSHPVCTGREGQEGQQWQALCSLSCLAKQGQGGETYLLHTTYISHLCTEVGWHKPHV